MRRGHEERPDVGVARGDFAVGARHVAAVLALRRTGTSTVEEEYADAASSFDVRWSEYINVTVDAMLARLGPPLVAGTRGEAQRRPKRPLPRGGKKGIRLSVFPDFAIGLLLIFCFSIINTSTIAAHHAHDRVALEKLYGMSQPAIPGRRSVIVLHKNHKFCCSHECKAIISSNFMDIITFT